MAGYTRALRRGSRSIAQDSRDPPVRVAEDSEAIVSFDPDEEAEDRLLTRGDTREGGYGSPPALSCFLSPIPGKWKVVPCGSLIRAAILRREQW